MGMKIEKQRAVLACLATGRYRVDAQAGIIYKRNGGELMGATIPAGYKQFTLFNGVRNTGRIEQGEAIKVIAYLHTIVYISVHGVYGEGLVIDHIDGNVSNNCIDNLRAVTQKVNVTNYHSHPAIQSKMKSGEFTPIRGDQIKALREMHRHGLSHSAIGRAINADRTSVSRICKIIDSGGTLKFEHWNKAGDKMNEKRRGKKRDFNLDETTQNE